MEYTIKQLADLAGVSTRTLRYYDEINLLSPKRKTESGYRIYGEKEVDRLQQILFFRELEIELKDIQKILGKSGISMLRLLEGHKKALEKRQQNLAHLLLTVDQSISSWKGEYKMENAEKFVAFKETWLRKNEELYGKEIRETYGENLVEKVNDHLSKITEEEFATKEDLEEQLLYLLEKQNLPIVISEETENIFILHKKWLELHWGFYNPKAHKQMGELYLHDGRFSTYYEKRAGKKAAEKLHAIIQFHTEKDSSLQK